MAEEELTHWKRLWCWEGLGAGEEGGDREWDGWMASLTRWTWVWVNSGRWWWTRRPGVLQFMGSQRVGHDWATELNWTELNSPTLCDPRDCSPTRLLCPWGFSEQEYWSGLPFPSPRDLPDPGIKPGSPTLQADALPPGRYLSHQGNFNNRKVSPDPLPQHTVWDNGIRTKNRKILPDPLP